MKAGRMPITLVFAGLLATIAVVSGRYQFRNLRRLRGGESLASDDRRYLIGQCRRRIVNSGLLLILAGMLAGDYFGGGMEELGRIATLKELNPPQEATEEDRTFVRILVVYWIVFLVILFAVVVVAIADYSATTLYGRQQLRRIRAEQSDLLERDLAVHRQKQLNDRQNRLGGTE
jgi:hypothetical protein